jgi:hypothetical protein
MSEGFLGALGLGSADTQADRECRPMASLGVAITKVAVADSYKGTCFF